MRLYSPLMKERGNMSRMEEPMSRSTAVLLVSCLVLLPVSAFGEEADHPAVAAVEKAYDRTGHQLDVLAKRIDDVL